tara:strand:+ start:133 stop:423 length:291 start_codon:yes stop_codon:yes gene_type:complete
VKHKVQESIAYMSGSKALPRSSGELVFNDDWERRVFALGVALCDIGQYEWNDFKACLIDKINSQEEEDVLNADYYIHWLEALEALLDKHNFVNSSD